MEEIILNSGLLALAFALGAIVPARTPWVALVAACGVPVVLACWFHWSRENIGDWDTYPGEWLMGLVFGVPVLIGVWVFVVIVGFLAGRALRTRLSAHRASRLSALR